MNIVIESLFLMFNSWWVYLIFGMLFGSFLNVVINRIPAGQSIVYPPSACPFCKTEIKWYDNIPVFSWLILRARCRSCKAPISIQYPLIEAACGLMATLLFISTGFTLRLLVILPLGYILVAISVIDLKTYSIPAKMQYALLTTAIAGIILNFFDPQVLNIQFWQSLAGGFCGFGILWLIQIIGRKIYKQEAMGGGDLYLLGFGGLLIGPVGVFWAFVLGSLLAVIAYIIPGTIKIIKKKSELLALSNDADFYFNRLSAADKNNPALIMLKMQIAYLAKSSDFTKLKQTAVSLFDNDNSPIEYRIEGFFRFLAVDDESEAQKALQKLEQSDLDSNCKIFHDTLNSDLLGYGTYEDNLHLIKKYSLKLKLPILISFLNREEMQPPAESIPTISQALEEVNSCDDNRQKLEKLLSFNRIYQYSGYTSEQLTIVSRVKELVTALEETGKQEVFAELAYVYYTDLFYKNYREELHNLKSCTASPAVNKNTVHNLYNLVLYRQFFFKQKLAFGPYLAIGIMLAFLYGTQISALYITMIENIILK